MVKHTTVLIVSGYNRKKEENRVWFSTREEAEGSGFVMAYNCKE
jgi:hypothetical protein